MTTRKPVPTFIRDQLFLQQKGRCKDCKKRRQEQISMHIHHIDGSNNDFNNFELLCPSCHGKKGKRLDYDLSWIIADIIPAINWPSSKKDRTRSRVVYGSSYRYYRHEIRIEILTTHTFWIDRMPPYWIKEIERH